MVNRVAELDDKWVEQYLICLEEWSQEMKDAGDQRRAWYLEMKDKGLRVQVALTESGDPAGFIQYLPIEHSILESGEGYFINCIWVHGHKLGRGDLRRMGHGRELITTAIADAKSRGAKGIAAWGLMIPIWMKASWFRKYGFKRVDRDGLSALMWKPFEPNAVAPKWLRRKKVPEVVAGKLRISIFQHGWCAAMNITAERVRLIANEYPDTIELLEYNTRDRSILTQWGISDAVFLDTKELRTGPPPSMEKLRSTIISKLRKKGLN